MTLKNKLQAKNPKNIERMSKTAKIIVFVGAVLGALLLWIYARGYDSTLFESTYNGIPVVVEGAEKLAEEKGFTLAPGQNFSSITIVAKGKRADLDALDPTDFYAYVDVSLAKGAGEQTLDIMVKAPNGIKVVSKSTETVGVVVDEFTQLTELLTVNVNAGEYRYAEGVVDINMVANPIAVTVSGPKSVLDTIEGAYVDFNLGGNEIRENIRGFGAIKLRDKNGKEINDPYVAISEPTAEVTITVTRQKSIPVKVVFVGGKFSPADYTLSVNAVTVKGASERLSAFGEIVLEIDETRLVPGKTTDLKFPIVSELPEGISSDMGGNITVSVTMPSLSVRTYTVNKKSITVKNLPEGYKVNVLDNVKVKVIGQVEAFEDFDSSLITAEIDYNDIIVEPDGTYSAAVKISLGDNDPLIYVQNIDYTVRFTVEGNDSPIRSILQ